MTRSLRHALTFPCVSSAGPIAPANCQTITRETSIIPNVPPPTLYFRRLAIPKWPALQPVLVLNENHAANIDVETFNPLLHSRVRTVERLQTKIRQQNRITAVESVELVIYSGHTANSKQHYVYDVCRSLRVFTSITRDYCAAETKLPINCVRRIKTLQLQLSAVGRLTRGSKIPIRRFSDEWTYLNVGVSALKH